MYTKAICDLAHRKKKLKIIQRPDVMKTIFTRSGTSWKQLDQQKKRAFEQQAKAHKAVRVAEHDKDLAHATAAVQPLRSRMKSRWRG